MLTYAYRNSKNNTKYVIMDCTNLDYVDSSFDTVVDTFGLQASYDFKKQYEEMKRVTKQGGKILILEMGESLWKSSNFKIFSNARKDFIEQGQHLYRNWEDLITNDRAVKVVKSKRKLHGRLFYYELEKL
jgi:ubiquinone/menaquinone biosynthesis C-methylase UbiE